MLVAEECNAEMDATPIHRHSPPPTPTPTSPPTPAVARRHRPRTHRFIAQHAGSEGAVWRAAAAEGVGAALLVALGALQPPAGGAPRALAAGALVAALVQCFGAASGAQLNPVVTLAALVRRRMPWRRAAAEVAAQLAGAAAGAALAAALRSPGAALVARAAAAPALRVLALETAAGAVLALANCAQWEPRAAAGDCWPLRIGVTVAALTLSIEETGASMNPARYLGPALVANSWDLCWVYVCGPAAGAAAAAAAYGALWAPATSDSRLKSTVDLHTSK